MNDERLTKLDEAVVEARDQLAEIDERLEEIGDVIEAEQAHVRVKDTRDARDQLAVGDDETVVIETAPEENTNGEDAVAHIGGIVTFVKPGGLDLPARTTAEVKITGVAESQAHAIALDVLD